jgi:hypothetical protein
MKPQFSKIVFVLLSSTWSLTNAQAMFAGNDELANRFRRIHAAQRENPERGQRIAEEAEANRKRQKKAVKELQARVYMEKQVRDWKWGLNYERFSEDEQNELETLLPDVIRNFEEEQKISHGTADSLLVELSHLDFQSLSKKLKKLGNTNVLNQQRQRRIQLEQEDAPLEEVHYNYDKENYIFLSENQDSYSRVGNFIPSKQHLTENEIQEIYARLKIDINGSADKKNPVRTAQARENFLKLREQQTGFIFLPTSTDGKLNALIKVLRIPNQNVDYLFYNKQNLPGGLSADERYAHLNQDYTLIALNNNLVFAISNDFQERKILSLSTRQVLRTAEMNAIYAVAEDLWAKMAPQPVMNGPINEAEAPIPEIESPLKLS